MKELSIYLFGPFRVNLDGEPVTTFESDKVRALLAYLAAETQVPHRREKLAGLLWPDRPERSARANLSRALSNLRTAIGDRAPTGDRDAPPGYLLITRQTIQFNSTSPAWVDVAAFTDLLQHRRSLHQPTSQPAIQQVEDAVDLYCGSLLEGFSLPGCPEFDEWAMLEGERLQRLALEALGRLSVWYEERGEVERSLDHVWRWVELAPWQESAHRRLMRLLADRGQRRAALAQYETCRRRLAEELDIQPSAETLALYEQILRETAVSIRSPAPRHNLRVPLTPFVGREAELGELGDRLRDPACRLLTLVGPGGIGKTRLALEAASNILSGPEADRFPDGVFQVRLVGLQSAEGIVPSISNAIGLSLHRRGEPKQQLLDYLSGKAMLLILDSFEHLPEGADLVVDVLRVAPSVRAMITSRTRLNLMGEHLFPVNGMEVPPPPEDAGRVPGSSVPVARGEPAALGEYEAVKLFLSGARRVCADFDVEAHALEVGRICRLVQGMPLAILLASAWVGTLPPAEIAARIGRGLDFLAADWRDVAERHRSVRAVFDHSWQMLTERERELFQALSVFRGSFNQEAARQVAGASVGELRLLMDMSFLHRLPTGRYEVHELLRQYGAERLRQTEELEGVAAAWEAVHNQHGTHYASALQQWGEDLRGRAQQAALAELDVEIGNARAAWSWASGRQQMHRLAQALDGLCLFYQWRVRYREGISACRQAADSLRHDVSRDSLRLQARMLTWQGAFNHLLQRTDVATCLFQESEELLNHPSLVGHDLRREKAFLLLHKGHAVLNTDREEARWYYGQSLTLFRALGDGWSVAAALRELGRIAQHFGAYNDARQLMEEGLAVQQSLGDQRGIADSLVGLATVATLQGQAAEAERMLRDCVTIFREMGSQADLADGLGMLGMALCTLGRFNEGHSVLEESISICRDLVSRGEGLAHWSAMLGIVELWLGRYQEARAQSDMARALCQEVSHPMGIGCACWVLAGVALQREGYAEAQQLCQEAVSLHRDIGQRETLSWALALEGRADWALGELARARKHLHEALRMAEEMRSFVALLVTLSCMTVPLAGLGEPEQAVELHALVSRHPFMANSRWFEDIAGSHIAAVAAQLPSDVVAAAHARGRTRDLWITAAELLEKLES